MILVGCMYIFIFRGTDYDCRENIFFDGALPESKRETRLCRLEKVRLKHELFCTRYNNNLKAQRCCMKKCYTIEPDKVLLARSLPARYKDIPENPFMVSTVFEDLKCRWNRRNITREANTALCSCLESLQEYPWADVTFMVPGEADAACSCVSREKGSAILSNDSDLLLHELGPHGCVLFLDSVGMYKGNCNRPADAGIKALRLRPADLVHRLGITDIRYFAYELNRTPQASFPGLVHRSRGAPEKRIIAPDYLTFMKEYQSALHTCRNDSHSTEHLPQYFDARVSELFLQCKYGDVFRLDGILHMYLTIINDDHARRCAWEAGLSYRELAYSIINTIRPATDRFSFVHEYVRRGQRIAIDKIALFDEDMVFKGMQALSGRLIQARAMIEDDYTSPRYWRMFALSEIYCRQINRAGFPGLQQLVRFLRLGHAGEALDWTDVHLLAQMQAVLYSLRILGQLLRASAYEETISEVKRMLSGLPPLYVLMKSRNEIAEEFVNEAGTTDLVATFFRFCERRCRAKALRPDEATGAGLQQETNTLEAPPQEEVQKCLCSNMSAERKCSGNIYEVLGFS